MKEIDAVGHRVVHGGEKFACIRAASTTLLWLRSRSARPSPRCTTPPTSPASTPAATLWATMCRMVAVFDTAFHQTMPGKAYMYAIPYEYYENDGIRRYGFHGTSSPLRVRAAAPSSWASPSKS